MKLNILCCSRMLSLRTSVNVFNFSTFKDFDNEIHHLFIGNISPRLSRCELISCLQSVGVSDFVAMRLCYTKRGEFKGKAYVDFLKKQQLQHAIQAIDGLEIDGGKLIADEALSRNQSAKLVLDPLCSLFVKNLPFSMTAGDIKISLNEAFGNNISCEIKLIASGNGQSRGFCQLNFATTSDAQNALSKLRDVVWQGRHIEVQQFSKQKIEPPSVFIGNIAADTTVDALTEMLNAMMGGNVVKSVKLGVEKTSKQFLGYAHVDFIDVKKTYAAIDYINGTRFRNRNLRAEMALRSK